MFIGYRWMRFESSRSSTTWRTHESFTRRRMIDRTGAVGSVNAMKRILILVLTTGVLLGANTTLAADDARPTQVSGNDFQGKILAIALRPPTTAVYLQDVHVRVLGGRTFLVGSYAKRSDTDKFPDLA